MLEHDEWEAFSLKLIIGEAICIPPPPKSLPTHEFILWFITTSKNPCNLVVKMNRHWGQESESTTY